MTMIKQLLSLAATGFLSWGVSAMERDTDIVTIDNQTDKSFSVCVGVKGSDYKGSFGFSYSNPVKVHPCSVRTIRKTELNREFQRNCHLSGVQVLLSSGRVELEDLGETVTVTYDQEKRDYVLKGTKTVDPECERRVQELLNKHYAAKRNY